jgi:hypothetical protein
MMKSTEAGSTPTALMRGRASAPQLVTIMASRSDCVCGCGCGCGCVHVHVWSMCGALACAREHGQRSAQALATQQLRKRSSPGLVPGCHTKPQRT